MDTCLKKDAPGLNSETRGENPKEDHTFKPFEQHHVRKRLGGCMVLQAMPTERPERFWHFSRHRGFSFPQYFIPGLPVPASTAFWMKTRG